MSVYQSGVIIEYARVASTTGQMTKAPVGGASMCLSIPPKSTKNISGIYAIVNLTNGHRYIGSSSNLPKRKYTHFAQLKKGIHHCKHLQNAFVKYGIEAFRFRIMLICEKRDLLRYEQLVMDSANPEYNAYRTAGSPLGMKLSEATKEKIRLAALISNRSIEKRKSVSAALKGKAHSKEHNERISQSQYGRKYSEETIRKMSQSAKNRTNQYVAWNKGISPSEETKRKQSESHKGIRYHRARKSKEVV